MTGLALALIAVLAALVLWLGFEVLRLKRRVAIVPEEGGVFTALQQLDGDLATAEELLTDLLPRVEALEGTLPLAIQHTAVVTFDAFDNVAGHLSRSFALLNGKADGVVITLLVGRDETRWYTKGVRGGQGVDPLSPEESEAVAVALSGRR